MRKKIKDMNYIHPIRTEKAGINGTENKIVFSKDLFGVAGANIWKIEDVFDNIENVEFALMWGGRSKIIADSFTVNIPKQNNNIADFEISKVYEPNKIIIECGFFENDLEKYEISYDENNKVLSYGNFKHIVRVNNEVCKDITGLIETAKKYYTERKGICKIIEE